MIGATPGRHQRRPAQGSDHVKHRRTRSGCYTCRNRRVKCDEGRPICERCRKGSRDCVYPDVAQPSKSHGAGSVKPDQTATQSILTPPSDDYDDEGDAERLKSIPDEDEGSLDTIQNKHSIPGTAQSLTQHRSRSRLSSETPSLVQDKGSSPSPSTEGSIGNAAQLHKVSQRPTKLSHFPQGTDQAYPDWSGLPQDLQFYLEYFVANVTHHHYSFKKDAGNFLHSTFLEAALRNKSLLYAVVGFSAFQRTLHNPEGKIQDFLQYYNKSVEYLLRSLRRGEGKTIDTLYSILQLATIEEYLGDFVNLLSHQKAAYSILTELFTPQTAIETRLNRILLNWYGRFDVFAGLVGGFETVLAREWFSTLQEFYAHQAEIEPDDILWKIDEASASVNLIAMELSVLFAKISKGEISMDQFDTENEILAKKIRDYLPNMDPALNDPRYGVTDFTGARPLDPDDIVNPYEPGIIQQGVLWPVNVCKIDLHALDLMRLIQASQILQVQISEKDATPAAFAICQMFEAVEYWPGSPKGSILSCLASLGLAAVVLPRDQRHMLWLRKKFAVVESHGYIYPNTFRQRMSDLFQDPSCMEWWLPNGENYPPSIRSIRNFVEERTSAPRDGLTEDLRDMKAIFGSLSLEDGKSAESTPPDLTSTMDSKNPDWAHPTFISEYGTGMEHSSSAQIVHGEALGFDDDQQQWFNQEGFLTQGPGEYRPS